MAVNYAHSAEQANQVCDELRAQGLTAKAYQADVRQVKQIHAMFDEIESDWGCASVLINNAGIVIQHGTEEFTEAAYDAILDTNLKGAYFCAQRAIAAMKSQQWGRIVNISSVHETTPTGSSAPYSMSKGGMLMMTRELARELGPSGITVNNVTPGAIRTDMNREVLQDADYEAQVVARIPARRIGDADEIAHAVSYLVSEEGAYVNGTSLFVDGGLSL